jgi:hypothetical protein
VIALLGSEELIITIITLARMIVVKVKERERERERRT